jgi:RimJ/RimL family protein N-acetyltransferase
MKLDVIPQQPVLDAGRFELRPVRKSDQGLIELHTSDPRVAIHTGTIPHPLPPGATEALIARALAPERDEDIWVMDGSKTGGAEVMGMISLLRMDRAQSEIGYWVAPGYWNTGVASDAVETLVQANPLQNQAIFASVFQDNPASARVLTNCGFQYLGDAEEFSVARGACVATWTYSWKAD